MIEPAVARPVVAGLAFSDEPGRIRRQGGGGSEQQAARLTRALSGAGGSDRASVLANLRTIDAIRPATDRPGMAYLLHEGEMLVFPLETAQQVRARVLAALATAAREARQLNDSTDFRMREHLRLNHEEQPFVGFAVSLVSGEEPVELQSRVLDPLSDSQIALRRYDRVAGQGSLAALGEVVLTGVERAHQASEILSRGIDASLAAAGSIVSGLTITRNLSTAIALSIGAIVAAPVVAAGVAGTGATGVLAGAATALGTSGVVGAGGAGLGFVSGAGGELLAGNGTDRALDAGLSEGRRVGTQGAVIGLGAGATSAVSGAVGLGAPGLTTGQSIVRGSLAQATGGGVSGVAGGLLNEPPQGSSRGEQALHGALTGLGLGVVGGTAGAFARPLSSPVARHALGVGLPSLAAGGATYLRTGDSSQALQTGAVGLAVGAAGQMRAGQGRTAGEDRAAAFGRSAAGAVRPYALAAGLGLYNSSNAFSMRQSGGGYSLSDPRPYVTQTTTSPATSGASTQVTTPTQTPTPAAATTVPASTATAASPPTTPTTASATVAATPVSSAAPTTTATPSSADETDFSGLNTPDAAPTRLRSAADAVREGSQLNADVMVGTHSVAPSVRKAAGVTGAQFESAHILAQTIGAAINAVRPGTYSPGRALTMLLRPPVHKAFDQGWVSRWNTRVASGQRTTVADAQDMLRDAIDRVPSGQLSPGEKGALHFALEVELYQTLGLSPGLVLF